MAWTAPTIAAEAVIIDATLTPTLEVPASDTSARATEQAFDNCY